MTVLFDRDPPLPTLALGVARNLALPEAPAGKQAEESEAASSADPSPVSLTTTPQPQREGNANQVPALNNNTWGRSWPMSQGPDKLSALKWQVHHRSIIQYQTPEHLRSSPSCMPQLSHSNGLPLRCPSTSYPLYSVSDRS